MLHNIFPLLLTIWHAIRLACQVLSFFNTCWTVYGWHQHGLMIAAAQKTQYVLVRSWRMMRVMWKRKRLLLWPVK